MAGVPLSVLGAWQTVQWVRWGRLPIGAGSYNLAAPLSNVLGFAARIGSGSSPELAWAGAIEPVGGIVVAVVVLALLPSNPVELSPRIAGLGYGARALLLAGGVWSSDWHFLRALAEWHVLAALILLASFSRLAPLPLLTMAPIWLWTAIVAIGP